ncbi:MAG TPA: hypothetical protein VHH53_08110, partial [Pseudonocardiaceae bacterium]|nr:hypothetical protein [Pseudonocardiaceae bacterium]
MPVSDQAFRRRRECSYTQLLTSQATGGAAAPWAARPVVLFQEDDQTKGKAMRFEIVRLDDADGTPVDTTVVD